MLIIPVTITLLELLISGMPAGFIAKSQQTVSIKWQLHAVYEKRKYFYTFWVVLIKTLNI